MWQYRVDWTRPSSESQGRLLEDRTAAITFVRRLTLRPLDALAVAQWVRGAWRPVELDELLTDDEAVRS
jgi:hypothetical protein